MFLLVSVILYTGGGGFVCAIPACIAGVIPARLAAGLWGGGLLLGGFCSVGCLLPGGTVCSQGVSALGGGVVAFCYGLLLWPSVMTFWFGGLLIEGGLLVWWPSD